MKRSKPFNFINSGFLLSNALFLTMALAILAQTEASQTNILRLQSQPQSTTLQASKANTEAQSMITKDEFLYPRSRYHGQVNPEDLMFNANLQEFAQRISFISNLQTNGKLSAAESYQQVKDLWQQLECTSAALEITAKLPHVSPRWED